MAIYSMLGNRMAAALLVYLMMPVTSTHWDDHIIQNDSDHVMVSPIARRFGKVRNLRSADSLKPMLSQDFESFELESTNASAHMSLSHLQKCKRYFDNCWDQSARVWKAGGVCQGALGKCEVQLCTSWTEAFCQQMTHQCSQVNKMCLNQSPSHQIHVGKRSNALLQQGSSKPLLFIHIPKSAGTAIEDVSVEHGVQWGRNFVWGLVMMPDGSYCNAYHVPPRYFTNPGQVYTASNAFCVTRHPYDRAVSEYKYLLSVDWGKNASAVYEKEPCTKDGLNYFLQQTLQRVLRGNRYVNDCHMIPQYEYAWGIDRQWCNEMIRIEDFPQAFNDLMHKYEFEWKMTEDNHDNAATTCKKLSSEDLTDETKQLLDLVYLEDFRLLNYQRSK